MNDRVDETRVSLVEYQCIKCGHQDTLKWWKDDHQPAPPMLTCTNESCRAGINKDLREMMQLGQGMAQKSPPTIIAH